MRLTLKPIGTVDPRVLDHLRGSLRVFGEVRIGSPVELPAQDFEPERRQYRALRLFDLCRPEAGDRVLGITEADLYEDGLRYVFGYADIGGRVAVVSVARLGGDPRGPKKGRAPWARRSARREQKFLDRCTKEAVHELGHTLGLTHDDRHPDCVMHFSATLADTDSKGRDYCAECAPKAELTLKRLRT